MSLTADPPCEEIIQLEALGALHLRPGARAHPTLPPLISHCTPPSAPPPNCAAVRRFPVIKKNNHNNHSLPPSAHRTTKCSEVRSEQSGAERLVQRGAFDERGHAAGSRGGPITEEAASDGRRRQPITCGSPPDGRPIGTPSWK